MDTSLCKSQPDQHAYHFLLQLQGNMDISFLTIQCGNDPIKPGEASENKVKFLNRMQNVS